MQRWQIVNAGENLFRPLLMRVTSEGVGKGISPRSCNHCPDNQIQHGLVIDRILGLSDSSITVLTRAQVAAMVAALPRSY